ncbi:nucleoporin Ndc1 [Anopheles nili]|uniref:nucleoporin Ndc1 n=1 Tax=Anopheles nili TaxID=185578 RepID=UPI00237AA0E0|nr:nucleoporin Ndc1 [Anopheles nili]
MDAIGSKDLAFRKICTERFISSIGYSLLQQYLLVTFFLLVVNFSILHPINWIVGTIRLLMSFYPWMVSIPLALAVSFHGIVLAKTCLLETRYHSTYFLQWYRNITQRSILLVTNCTVGFLMVWMYTRFLRDEHRLLFLSNSEHVDIAVLNERFIYLIMSGVFGGCYFFVRGHSNLGAVDFPIMLLPKGTQYWNKLISTFTESMRKTIVALLIYTSCYYTFSMLFRSKIASLAGGVQLQDVSVVYSFCSILMDVRLMIYTWLFLVLILSNMNLMNALFRIFLNEPQMFSIETSIFHSNVEPMLADALGYKQIPIIQQLAAEDLFTVSDTLCSGRRKELFALTVPGGHPNNWRKVYDVCKQLIQDFTHELDQSISSIEPKPAPPMMLMGGVLRPTSSMDRERFLMKQYNENFGIRSLSTPSVVASNGSGEYSSKPTSDEKSDSRLYSLVVASLKRIPGFDYFFVESKSAKSYYLLSVQAQLIMKVSQSLVAIASRSLDEDSYGVMQNDLPCLIHTLLELKKVIDKIGSIDLDVRKVDRNYIALKGTIKRSLYRITTAFGPYIKHLVIDPEDMKALQSFISFREV